MAKHRIYTMSVASVYPHYVAKAEKKGRTRAEVDGTIARPDGGTWHITWSLAEGRAAKESNDVIAAHGFAPLAGGEVPAAPARWD